MKSINLFFVCLFFTDKSLIIFLVESMCSTLCVAWQNRTIGRWEYSVRNDSIHTHHISCNRSESSFFIVNVSNWIRVERYETDSVCLYAVMCYPIICCWQ
jgi:hypothetical protein